MTNWNRENNSEIAYICSWNKLKLYQKINYKRNFSKNNIFKYHRSERYSQSNWVYNFKSNIKMQLICQPYFGGNLYQKSLSLKSIFIGVFHDLTQQYHLNMWFEFLLILEFHPSTLWGDDLGKRLPVYEEIIMSIAMLQT